MKALSIIAVARAAAMAGILSASAAFALAASASASPVVYNYAEGFHHGRVQPRAIYVGSGGSPYVIHLRWSHWNRATASGHGRALGANSRLHQADLPVPVLPPQCSRLLVPRAESPRYPVLLTDALDLAQRANRLEIGSRLLGLLTAGSACRLQRQFHLPGHSCHWQVLHQHRNSSGRANFGQRNVTRLYQRYRNWPMGRWLRCRIWECAMSWPPAGRCGRA